MYFNVHLYWYYNLPHESLFCLIMNNGAAKINVYSHFVVVQSFL